MQNAAWVRALCRPWHRFRRQTTSEVGPLDVDRSAAYGLGTFAPPLDSAGNSVKGQLVARFLSQCLGMNLFVSKPVG